MGFTKPNTQECLTLDLSPHISACAATSEVTEQYGYGTGKHSCKAWRFPLIRGLCTATWEEKEQRPLSEP